MYKKLLTIFIIALISAGFFTSTAAAYNADETAAAFKESSPRIICVAHRGEWHDFPENSVEAVNAATVYDMVSVDVKSTSDSRLVLMADETVDRMCVDERGNAVSGAVSSFTLNEIHKLFLRNGNGSPSSPASSCRVATLEEAIITVGNNAALMLNVSLADFKNAYDKVKEMNSLEHVVFRVDGKLKDVISATKEMTPAPVITGNYQGNIIFLATGTVKSCFDNSVNTIELGSANGHGVLYDNFLLKRFDSKGRAMVSMVNGRCGKRADNETGWNDLISRGYSVIETDYPNELKEYISRVEKSAQELERYIDLYKNTDLKPFTSDTENAFKDALANAQTKLTEPSSLSELDTARYSLQASHDNLTTGEKKAVTLAFNFSAGRIIAVVLCAAAFLISQILLYKQRVKK